MFDTNIENQYVVFQRPNPHHAFHSGQADLLRDRAKDCAHITEVGVNIGASTRAFMAGYPTEMVGIDIKYYDKDTEHIKALAAANNIKYTYHIANSLSCPLVDTDLLLLDGDHSYEVVADELKRWNGFVRKWIILHDTNKDGQFGPTGYFVKQATLDFLTKTDKWVLELEDKRLAGLMILKRVKK